MDFQYEDFRYEFDQAAKKLADDLTSMVNKADDQDLRNFAEQMTHDHRTLVQKKMKLVLYFIEELAKLHDSNYYDLRNEASCKLAKKIVETFDKYDRMLPHI